MQLELSKSGWYSVCFEGLKNGGHLRKLPGFSDSVIRCHRMTKSPNYSNSVILFGEFIKNSVWSLDSAGTMECSPSEHSVVSAEPAPSEKFDWKIHCSNIKRVPSSNNFHFTCKYCPKTLVGGSSRMLEHLIGSSSGVSQSHAHHFNACTHLFILQRMCLTLVAGLAA